MIISNHNFIFYLHIKIHLLLSKIRKNVPNLAFCAIKLFCNYYFNEQPIYFLIYVATFMSRTYVLFCTLSEIIKFFKYLQCSE